MPSKQEIELRYSSAVRTARKERLNSESVAMATFGYVASIATGGIIDSSDVAVIAETQKTLTIIRDHEIALAEALSANEYDPDFYQPLRWLDKTPASLTPFNPTDGATYDK